MEKKVSILAKKYLTEKDNFIAENYRKEAIGLLSKIEFSTNKKTLESIGVSYIGGVNQSSKLVKNEKKNYLTYAIYLLPANASGFEVCPMRSEGCTVACLGNSGRVIMDINNEILTARLVKTCQNIG